MESYANDINEVQQTKKIHEIQTVVCQLEEMVKKASNILVACRSGEMVAFGRNGGGF